jgi:lysophospholipase L1-like esterase
VQPFHCEIPINQLNMKKALLISSLSLNVIIISAFAIKRLYYSQQPAAVAPSAWSVTWDRQKNDLYSNVPIDSGDIVFVGDSHVERFLLNDYFPCQRVRNRGIGSNTTRQVIARLDSIVLRKPSKLFLQIGINDLSFGNSSDTTYNNIVKIIRRVDRSKTSLYVVSLFPTRGQERYLNDAVKSLNVKLADYCIRNNITFVNIYPMLLKNGELAVDLTSDDTHLNGKGYDIWAKEIEKHVR